MNRRYLLILGTQIACCSCANTGTKESAAPDTPVLTNAELEKHYRRLDREVDGRKRDVARLRGEYVISPGDTFSKMSRKFSISTEELRRLNPDLDPSYLRVGQVLKLR